MQVIEFQAKTYGCNSSLTFREEINPFYPVSLKPRVPRDIKSLRPRELSSELVAECLRVAARGCLH